jgi:hypothetical protein
MEGKPSTEWNLSNRIRSFRKRHGAEDVGLAGFRKTLTDEIVRTTGNIKLAREMPRRLGRSPRSGFGRGHVLLS